ncbi:MAG: HAMP domain-containing protein, partial [Cystobacter sp.]
MSLRLKLLLAQVPLALALLWVGVVAISTLRELGRAGQDILADNYRSVLAMQDIIERLERVDSAALFVVAGERERGVAQRAEHLAALEHALQVQEGNITEPGEAEATRRLRQVWSGFRSHSERLFDLGPEEARGLYFGSLAPDFEAARSAARAILVLNQDAMMRKSEAQQRQSQRVNVLMGLVVVGSLAGGLFASVWLTQRALRPVGVLSRAVQRLGEGDLGTRAVVEGRDEISGLARDFNTMAEALQRYQRSSLGELLQAQASAQAAIDSLPDVVVVVDVEGAVLNVNRAAEEALHLSVEEGGLGRVEPEVRAVLERVRAHVLGGRGAYLPSGYEEAVRTEAPEGARWLLPRGGPVYGEG